MSRNKYPEQTREQILDTATRLFLQQGYEHTTIQNIIDQLGGLTKGAVYHHFSSKEAILNAVAARILRTIPCPPLGKNRSIHNINRQSKADPNAARCHYRPTGSPIPQTGCATA